jgi:hypothetical protein
MLNVYFSLEAVKAKEAAKKTAAAAEEAAEEAVAAGWQQQRKQQQRQRKQARKQQQQCSCGCYLSSLYLEPRSFSHSCPRGCVSQINHQCSQKWLEGTSCYGCHIVPRVWSLLLLLTPPVQNLLGSVLFKIAGGRQNVYQ